MAEYGTPGSPTYSKTLDTLDQIMADLADNVDNSISARKMRDVILTLYNTQATSATVSYTQSIPVPLPVGGIPAGATFSEVPMQQMWDNLLQQYRAPIASIFVSPSIKVKGDTSNISMFWSATSYNPTVSIVVSSSAGYNNTPALTTSEQSLSLPTTVGGITPTSYTIRIQDNKPTTTERTVTVGYASQAYWGMMTNNLDTIAALPDTGTNSLQSTIIGFTKRFADAVALTQIGLIIATQYFVYAYPASLSAISSAKVGGFGLGIFNSVAEYNASSKLGGLVLLKSTSYSFTNEFGYAEAYRIYVLVAKSDATVNLELS
jgi:hypothetical protein